MTIMRGQTIDARKTFRRAVSCTTLLLALCGATSAHAAPTLSFEPAFAAGTHLGEPATLTAKVTIAGTEYHGQPEPLHQLNLRLPAGSILSNEQFPTCPRASLEQHGPAGCPKASPAGPAGSFTAFVRFGIESVEEHGTLEPFFAEGGGLYLYFFATSPVAIEIISGGHYEPASAPFGPAVNFEVPFIETVPGAPYASFTAINLGLGAIIHKGPQEIGSVTAPESCPPAGLLWRTDATFNDETGLHEMTAGLEAESACPAAGSKTGTTTDLSTSNASPTVGESITYTATVAPKTPSASAPSGIVRFLDGGAPIAGCEAVTVVPAASTSTATCHATPETGTHTITGIYEGDSNFLRSEAAGLVVTVSAGSGEEAKRHEEEATAAAAKKHQEEEAAAKAKAEGEAKAAAEAKAKAEAEAAAKKKAEEEQAKKSSTKPLTRAQLLGKALKQCKKEKPKSKRSKCEAAAKRKYGPKKKSSKKKK